MVWLNEVTDPLKRKCPHANCTTFAAVVPSGLVVAGGGWASFTSGSVFSWTEVPFVVLSKMSVTVSVSDAPVHWGVPGCAGVLTHRSPASGSGR